MNPRDQDNLELDITRMLDGELSETERAELDRRLVRDPSAHRLCDAIASADRLADDALRAAVSASSGRGGAAGLELPPRRRRERKLLLAAAAAIVLAATVGALWYAAQGGPMIADLKRKEASNASPSRADRPAVDIPPGAEALIWRVWDAQGGPAPRGPADTAVPLPSVSGPRDVRRHYDRQLYGVYDEANQTIHLFGVDRVQTDIRARGKDM